MNKTIVLDKHESVYDTDYVEELQAEVERLRDALKEIAGRENQGNPYDPNDHPDPYSMIDEAKEALQQSRDTAGGE